MILPNVSGPTGTVMGPYVSLTGYPLTNPSVESIAIVLTLESPKCYATSKISFWGVSSTYKAFKIGGRDPSN